MVEKTQRAFSGGELTPGLYGRTDIGRYDVSLKLMENFTAHPNGGASNRAGFEYINGVENDNFARLVRFVFNDGQSYILEFTEMVMRVYRDGVLISGFSLVTPYLEEDLMCLTFSQSADVVTITHVSYKTKDLIRLADNNWTLTDTVFDPFFPGNLFPSAPGVPVPPPADLTDYIYAVTAISDTTFEESYLQNVQENICWNINQSNVDLGRYNNVFWTGQPGVYQYKIYRGLPNNLSGVLGFIGTVDGASSNFQDTILEPDFTISPPRETLSPVLDTVDNYPGCSCYYQQRKIYSGSNNKPQSVELGALGDFDNFSRSDIVKSSDSISVTLNSLEVNQIRHMVPIKGGVLIFSSGAGWFLTGGGGPKSPVTPASISADPQEYRGIGKPAPLIVGNTILYIQDRGGSIRDVEFSFDVDSYIGNSLTRFADHLFKKIEIIQWAYSELPDSVVWAVRSDGLLLAMTYVKEENVWAWGRHPTNGFVESVAVVPEGDEDVVYISVKRNINGIDKRFVERLHTREFSDVRDAFFVDSGLTLDDPIAITDITQANPGVVTAAGHGLSNGNRLDLSDIVGMTELNNNQYQAGNVTASTFEILDAYSGDPIDTSGFGEYESGGFVRQAFNTVGNLGHLEGETVIALANGNVIYDKVVTGGEIDLGDVYASRVHAGLQYTSNIEMLDFAAAGQVVSRGRKKLVTEVVVNQQDSRGLQIGPGSDKLVPVKEREQEGWNEEIQLQNGDVVIPITNDWNNKGSVYMRCPDPLPMTIRSVTPNVTVSDQ